STHKRLPLEFFKPQYHARMNLLKLINGPLPRAQALGIPTEGLKLQDHQPVLQRNLGPSAENPN
ncbi:MAG: hypothetical protein RMK65_01685, partial [Anaerolineae bacterium]|nr:hypothetical protein [Anaerolineae bacterium]